MTSYAIARLSKLKKANLGGSESHTSRKRDTPNANLDQKNIRIIGDPKNYKNLEHLVLEKIAQQQKRKIRPDAVYCVEFLLTASPQYFRPDNPRLGGYYKIDRLEAWTDVSQQWLEKQYGDRIVRAELHLDEMTPHIHAYFVPLDKDGQLRCHHFFDGRQKIRKFQDSYYAAVEHLGLERGIKGSTTRYKDIKDFYRIVEEGKDLEINALNEKQIKNKAADRDRAVKQKIEMEATAKRLLQENQALEQQLQNLRLQNRLLHEQIEKQDQTNNDLALDSVAWHLGLIKEDRKWQGYGNIITINDSGFYDLASNKRGSSAIELVMEVNNCKLDSALAWLNDRFGEEEMVRCVAANTLKFPGIIRQTSPLEPFSPPKPASSNWQPVRDYLIQQWGLDQKIVTALHQKRRIYADEQHNAVFIMRQLPDPVAPNPNFIGTTTGAFLQDTKEKNNSTAGYAQGTKRTQGWFYFNFGGQPTHEIQKVVLCKSPIDALSCATLGMELRGGSTPKSRTMYLAVDSTRNLPLEFLKKIPTVVAAYSNEKLNNQIALEIQQLLPQAKFVQPHTHDWNQELLQLRRQEKNHQLGLSIK